MINEKQPNIRVVQAFAIAFTISYIFPFFFFISHFFDFFLPRDDLSEIRNCFINDILISEITRRTHLVRMKTSNDLKILFKFLTQLFYSPLPLHQLKEDFLAIVIPILSIHFSLNDFETPQIIFAFWVRVICKINSLIPIQDGLFLFLTLRFS